MAHRKSREGGCEEDTDPLGYLLKRHVDYPEVFNSYI